jgi:prepilin-type N-terminal cleavage/methylation domain-containing protein
MQRMRFTRRFRADQGFTLFEVLVATMVMSVALATAASFFIASRYFLQLQITRIETQQALRTTLDMLARDLRLSGACLPITGDFSPLDGTNSGTTDAVVTRTGLVQSDLSCVHTTLTATMGAADKQATVASTSGFATGMRVYIFNGTTGEFFNLTGVPSGTLLTTGAVLSQSYPATTSSIYAVDERSYAIDTSNAAWPVLTLAVNQGTPSPIAGGITTMNIQYQLASNCPSCDVVDLPSSSQWSLVTQLFVTVTARARLPWRNGTYFQLTQTIGVKPRNLIPG